MLPKQYRLPSPEFRGVLKSGKKAFSANLMLKFRENRLTLPRFGFIVSTKFNKRATARNRAKRLMREVIRLNLSKIKAGYDFIFSMKGEAPELEYPGMEREIKEILLKENLLKTS